MRLIDVDALIDDWNKAIKRMVRDLDGKTPVDFGLVIREVSKAPTIDAVEVVHGRWIQSEPGYRLCSHCMADVAIYSGHRNYCPNCGAKMDLED